MSFGPTGSLPIAAAPFFFGLTYAGKPVVIRAMPQSFTIRAETVRFEFDAVPQGFTFRGGP